MSGKLVVRDLFPHRAAPQPLLAALRFGRCIRSFIPALTRSGAGRADGGGGVKRGERCGSEHDPVFGFTAASATSNALLAVCGPLIVGVV